MLTIAVLKPESRPDGPSLNNVGLWPSEPTPLGGVGKLTDLGKKTNLSWSSQDWPLANDRPWPTMTGHCWPWPGSGPCHGPGRIRTPDHGPGRVRAVAQVGSGPWLRSGLGYGLGQVQAMARIRSKPHFSAPHPLLPCPFSALHPTHTTPSY